MPKIEHPLGGRSTEEWFGKTPDTRAPDYVRDRVFERHKKRCYKCTRDLRPGDAFEIDHVIAIINGGENRERNLAPICDWCHDEKTKADVAEKSRVYQKRSKNNGTKSKSKTPVMGSRNTPWKRTFYNGVQRR